MATDIIQLVPTKVQDVNSSQVPHIVYIYQAVVGETYQLYAIAAEEVETRKTSDLIGRQIK